jgi:hypothetical protein
MTENAAAIINDISPQDNQALEKCISFLNSIGIKTIRQKLPPGSFLPGLDIQEGSIIVDTELLKYPGDILHEAGHIAVVPAAERNCLSASVIEKRAMREAEEMMAIAWSYAACVHLKLDPYFVFHDKGYKGGGNYIADNFINKNYFGLPMLQWTGLTFDEKNAAANNVAPYPNMIKWLRD